MPSPAPDTSKRAVFLRRSASTLGLWVVVAAAFASRWAWAYVGLVGVLTVIATLEYFRMLKAGGVKCFPRYGITLAVVYSVVLYWMLLGAPGADQMVGPADGESDKPARLVNAFAGVPDWFDGAAIFAALAGSFFLQLRYPIRGLEALQTVAS